MIFLLWGTQLFIVADVKSTDGNINFDTNSDGTPEAKLNSTGLAIGNTSPSANLHVEGNAIITNTLSIGSTSSSDNLALSGTMGFQIQSISDNTTLANSSIILADTSSGNILLTLPDAIDVLGRQYEIKKTDESNKLIIQGGGIIDSYSQISLENTASTLPYLSVMSTANHQWSILNMSGNGELSSSDNLLAWWKLDETSGTTASDSSGFGYQGSLSKISGTFSFASNTIQGPLSNALALDGQDLIDIGDIDALEGLDTFSISIWVNLPNHGGSGNNIVCKSSIYALQSSLNKATFIIGTTNNAWPTILTTTNSIPNDEWAHVVATYDGTTMRAYINATQDGTTTAATGALLSNTSTLQLSGVVSLAGFRYNGSLDDVRIYNKALSVDEINNLYSQGR